MVLMIKNLLWNLYLLEIMGKLKDAILSNIDDFETKWINVEEPNSAQADEIQASTKIVLKIIQFMKLNGLKQKDLAQKLEVSPQYINKLLHGQVSNITVGTAIRYGKLLGIELVTIPENTTNKIQVRASMTLEFQSPKTRKAIDYSNNTKYNYLILGNKTYQKYDKGIS